MSIYVRNRTCHCARCRARGLMGGAILVTLGILFLIQEYRDIDLDRTWPALLIVIGVLSFASRTASVEGHVQPSWMGGTASSTPPGQSNSGQTSVDPQVKP